MTRVYVAGSSSELERAEGVIAMLRAHGVEVTHDWPASFRNERAHGITQDADLSPMMANVVRRACCNAVKDAEVVLLLAPTTATRGAWVELGYALRRADEGRCRVMVSGSTARDSAFTSGGRIVGNDVEAVALIARGDW